MSEPTINKYDIIKSICIFIAAVMLLGNLVFWTLHIKTGYEEKQRLLDIHSLILSEIAHTIPDTMTINHHYEVNTTNISLAPSRFAKKYHLIKEKKDSLNAVLDANHSVLSANIDSLLINLTALRRLSDKLNNEYVDIPHALTAEKLAGFKKIDPQLKITLAQLTDIEHRYDSSITYLHNHLQSLEDFFKVWKQSKVNELLQSSNEDNYADAISADYKALSGAHQNIADKMYLFEDIYNRKRLQLSEEQLTELGLDGFYIELQDYIYNKFINKKTDVSTENIFVLKELLGACLAQIRDCQNKINEIYTIYHTFNNNAENWQAIENRYNTILELCKEGNFEIADDVKVSIHARDPLAFLISPMESLSKMNNGLNTGQQWLLIPTKSGKRMMSIEAEITLKDKINGKKLVCKADKKIHVDVKRTRFFETVGLAKSHQSHQEE
jgi:hypothetical protein